MPEASRDRSLETFGLIKLPIFLLLTLMMTSCGFMYPDIRLSRDVVADEIVGFWILTDDSLRDIQTSSEAASLTGKARDYSIEIRGDSTLQYRSFMQMPTRTVDYQGSWKLVSLADKNKSNRLDILLDIVGDYYISFDFTEEDGRLTLWTYFGDPDSWRLAKYQKHREQGGGEKSPTRSDSTPHEN